MKRTLLTFRLALETIIGLLCLSYMGNGIVWRFLMQVTRTTFIVALIGIGLVWDALRLRRKLNQLGASRSTQI